MDREVSGPNQPVSKSRGALSRGVNYKSFYKKPLPSVTGFVCAKHPTGVYLRGSRLQGGSLDPFGTVTYASPNGALPLRVLRTWAAPNMGYAQPLKRLERNF